MSGCFTRRTVAALAIAILAALCPPEADAQQRRQAPARGPAPRQPLAVRGFGDLGAQRFSAADAFKATLGSSTGVFFGGGAEVVLPQRLFVNLHLSHFSKSGERVFVNDDEVFPLGIDMKVAMTPVEATVGYRFQPRGRSRNVIPYVGGGLGWYKYTETSDFAETSENVSDTLQGYHLLGGAELRMGRIFAIAGEGQWTTVPDALDGGVSSAADAFGESNLGGLGFRVRFIVGR
jgi:hypothetical protein